MHEFILITLEVLGIGFLLWGFARKSRGLMLLGGLLLLMGGPVHNRVRGFVVGGLAGLRH